MVLGEIFSKETVIVNLESTEKDELFEELVEKIHSAYPNFDRGDALSNLNERESKMTTGIMHNVAVPHALIPSINKTIGAIGISKSGIDYDSLDKAPVYVVFMLIGADGDTEHHIQVLRQLALVLQTPDFVSKIIKCNSVSEIYNFLCKTEESISD